MSSKCYSYEVGLWRTKDYSVRLMLIMRVLLPAELVVKASLVGLDQIWGARWCSADAWKVW